MSNPQFGEPVWIDGSYHNSDGILVAEVWTRERFSEPKLVCVFSSSIDNNEAVAERFAAEHNAMEGVESPEELMKAVRDYCEAFNHAHEIGRTHRQWVERCGPMNRALSRIRALGGSGDE